MLKKVHEATKNCDNCLKGFNDPEDKNVRDYCHYVGLYHVKINVKLAGMKNEDGKEICKNIQLRFIDSCRFMPIALKN